MNAHQLTAQLLVSLFSILLAANAAAFVTNATITFHDDPNNYLNLNGLVSLGDITTGTFSYTAPSASSTEFLPGVAEHVFDIGTVSNLITINGTPKPGSAAANAYSSVIVNNASFSGLEFGDFYSFNQFFASPEPAFTSIVWSIGFFDSTATAHNSTDFYELTSMSGFETISVSATLINALTQINQVLFIAEVQAVPLPGAIGLLVSGLAGLIAVRYKRIFYKPY